MRGRSRRLVWLNPETEQFWATGDSEMRALAAVCDTVRPCQNLKQLTDFITSLVLVDLGAGFKSCERRLPALSTTGAAQARERPVGAGTGRMGSGLTAGAGFSINAGAPAFFCSGGSHAKECIMEKRAAG